MVRPRDRGRRRGGSPPRPRARAAGPRRGMLRPGRGALGGSLRRVRRDRPLRALALGARARDARAGPGAAPRLQPRAAPASRRGARAYRLPRRASAHLRRPRRAVRAGPRSRRRARAESGGARLRRRRRVDRSARGRRGGDRGALPRRARAGPGAARSTGAGRAGGAGRLERAARGSPHRARRPGRRVSRPGARGRRLLRRTVPRARGRPRSRGRSDHRHRQRRSPPRARGRLGSGRRDTPGAAARGVRHPVLGSSGAQAGAPPRRRGVGRVPRRSHRPRLHGAGSRGRERLCARGARRSAGGRSHRPPCGLDEPAARIRTPVPRDGFRGSRGHVVRARRGGRPPGAARNADRLAAGRCAHARLHSGAART